MTALLFVNNQCSPLDKQGVLSTSGIETKGASMSEWK